MYCRKCGKQVPDDSNYCIYCSEPIAVNTNKINMKKSPDIYQNNMTKEVDNVSGIAIASLILGIISIALVYAIFIPVITGIIAIIFGCIQLSKGKNKSFVIAGIITGAIGLVIGMFFTFVVYLDLSDMDVPSTNNSYEYNNYDDSYDDLDDIFNT